MKKQRAAFFRKWSFLAPFFNAQNRLFWPNLLIFLNLKVRKTGAGKGRNGAFSTFAEFKPCDQMKDA